MRLERLHRYAPRSEKLKDRIFNEAEQAAAEAEETDDVETAPIADTGLADAEQPEPKKRGRRPLPDGLPRERVEHDLPEEQRSVRAAGTGCIGWARSSASSCISR